LPASFYSIASSSKQQRSSRSLSLVAVVVVEAAVVVLVVVVVALAAAVALVVAAAPLSHLNSVSIFYTFLRRLSTSRPTTSYLVAAYPYNRLVECPLGLFLYDARDR
jgi:hypothetical protein